MIGEKKQAGGAAASIGEDKIGSVGDDPENHVTCAVTNRGVRVSGKIVEEHVASLFSFLSWPGLIVGDFVERNNDGGINGATVVEEGA